MGYWGAHRSLCIACLIPRILFSKVKERGTAALQVLRLMPQAYLLSGQPALTLTCVQSLRKLQVPPDDAPSLCLTAIEALFLVGSCMLEPGLTEIAVRG